MLIGSFQDTTSPIVPDTRLAVLHCRCSGEGARLVIPAEAGDSVSLYVRRGRVQIDQEQPRGPIPIETFQTAFFQVRVREAATPAGARGAHLVGW